MKDDFSEYMSQFNVNEYGTILNPGKFEGELRHVPYYYDRMLNGDFGDVDVFVGGTWFHFFTVTDAEKDCFPETLDDTYGLMLWENEQGFVYARSIWSRDEFDSMVAEYERESEREGEE